MQRINHSVFDMRYHLVLVVKYRRKVLDDAISHVVFSARPATELSKFVKPHKAAPSRLVKKEFPRITEKLWKSHFWKTGFFISTTGGTNSDTVKKYAQEQRG